MSTAPTRHGRVRVTLQVASGLVVVLALAHSAYAWIGHREARARWSEISDRLGEPDYDAAESDRRYLAVEERAESLETSLQIAGASALLLAVTLWHRRRAARSK